MSNENRLTELRCGRIGELMSRLFELPPYDQGFTVWVCGGCGALAIHNERSGDIFWYGASAVTRKGESWPEDLEADSIQLWDDSGEMAPEAAAIAAVSQDEADPQ